MNTVTNVRHEIATYPFLYKMLQFNNRLTREMTEQDLSSFLSGRIVEEIPSRDTSNELAIKDAILKPSTVRVVYFEVGVGIRKVELPAAAKDQSTKVRGRVMTLKFLTVSPRSVDRKSVV